MTHKYSYSDYTTKGHGVIEGNYKYHGIYGPGFRPKYHTASGHVKVSSIPSGYVKAHSVSDISAYVNNTKTTKKTILEKSKYNKLVKEIKQGAKVKVGDYIIVYGGKSKQFMVYKKKLKESNPSKKPKSNVPKNESTEKTYRHLKAIQDKAIARRRNQQT